jgi:hypothetical protein
VIVGVEVHTVGLGEFGDDDEGRERVEVVVESAACAIELEGQDAVGADLIDAGFIGVDAPEEITSIVDGDPGGGDSEARPVAVVVPCIALAVGLLAVNVIRDAIGDGAEPFLDFFLLIGSADAAVANFEIRDGGAGQEPSSNE